MKQKYEHYAICFCGYRTKARYHREFFEISEWRAVYDFCPKCGRRSESNCTIQMSQWVSIRKWYNPLSWFKGYWLNTNGHGDYWKENAKKRD